MMAAAASTAIKAAVVRATRIAVTMVRVMGGMVGIVMSLMTAGIGTA